MLKNSLLSHLPPEVICSVLVINFQAFIFPDFSHAHQGVRPSASDFDKYLSWAPAYLPQLCGFRLLCPWAVCHTSPTLPQCLLPGTCLATLRSLGWGQASSTAEGTQNVCSPDILRFCSLLGVCDPNKQCSFMSHICLRICSSVS